MPNGSQFESTTAMIGMPSLPIAAMLTSLSLAHHPAWSPARRSLLLTANLTWISLVLMFATVFIGLSQSGGEFGPHILAGWPNRFMGGKVPQPDAAVGTAGDDEPAVGTIGRRRDGGGVGQARARYGAARCRLPKAH